MKPPEPPEKFEEYLGYNFDWVSCLLVDWRDGENKPEWLGEFSGYNLWKFPRKNDEPIILRSKRIKPICSECGREK